MTLSIFGLEVESLCEKENTAVSTNADRKNILQMLFLFIKNCN